ERLDRYLERAPDPAVEAASRAAGRALAAIHAVTFPSSGWFGPDLSIGTPPWPTITWSEMLCGWVDGGSAGERLQATVRHRLLGLIADHADEVESLDAHSRLVHADFTPWNLLTRDGDFAGILDWEGAYAGNPMVDIGIYLRFSDRHPGLKEGFAAG